MTMKKVLALLMLSLLMSACIRVNTEVDSHRKSDSKTDGAFIHISKGPADTHDVLMALMLADKFSSSNDVLVFFDKEGIEMVTRDAPNLEMVPFDASDEIFKRLVELDVTILACPACMKVAGMEEEDLREGVQMAEKEQFFDFTEGRILTLDY
jgi:predicted peroxiredoxin